MTDWDQMCADYKREEFARLNGHFPWTLAHRLAFSRWRRAVLRLTTASGWIRRHVPRRCRSLFEHWHDRLLDALYPDDCAIQFAPVAPSAAAREAVLTSCVEREER